MSYEDDFTRRSWFGMASKVDRKDGTGGHFRLFGTKPPHGWVVYMYHNMAGSASGWARRRVWNFGLFAVHHISEGKSTEPHGWHLTFCKIRLSAAFIKADTFRIGK